MDRRKRHYRTRESVFRKSDLVNILRSSGRPEEEILKLVQMHGNKHLPSILRVVGGNRTDFESLFNGMTLALLQSSKDNSTLCSALDHGSLIRLSAQAGGETVRIPTLEEVVTSHLAALGLYAIKVKGFNVYKAFGLVSSILRKLGIEHYELEDFQQALSRTSDEVIQGLLSKSHEGGPTIFQQLQESLEKLDKVGDKIQDAMKHRMTPETLVELYGLLVKQSIQIRTLMHETVNTTIKGDS